jgi:hypothetical protein
MKLGVTWRRPESERDGSDRGSAAFHAKSRFSAVLPYARSPAALEAYTLSGMKFRRILFMRTLLPLRGLPQSGSQQGSSQLVQR